ncbi:MAG: desulfoferrodoxin family protein [Clostridia bacterium]|nr:desulfoferrodoxin family protein [Clostridia bacterium]
MKKNVRFYICSTCGNQIGLIHSNGNDISCCGHKMDLMEVNESEELFTSHLPIFSKSEDEIVIKVGNKEHPMTKEHFIMWIAQVSDHTTFRTQLYPEQSTTLRFKYIPNSTIYAYCNKHGLFAKKVDL